VLLPFPFFFVFFFCFEQKPHIPKENSLLLFGKMVRLEDPFKYDEELYERLLATGILMF
jgi:hypothetical protein